MDFVEKNRDDLNQNLQDLIASSSNDFVKSQLFSPAMMSGDPDVAMGIATGASSPVAAAMSPVRQQKGKTQVPAVSSAPFFPVHNVAPHSRVAVVQDALVADGVCDVGGAVALSPPPLPVLCSLASFAGSWTS